MGIEENAAVKIIVTMLDEEVAGGFSTDVTCQGTGAEDCIQARGSKSAAQIDVFHPRRAVPFIVPADFQ